jgi:hypothetical protein
VEGIKAVHEMWQPTIHVSGGTHHDATHFQPAEPFASRRRLQLLPATVIGHPEQQSRAVPPTSPYFPPFSPAVSSFPPFHPGGKRTKKPLTRQRCRINEIFVFNFLKKLFEASFYFKNLIYLNLI